MSKRVGFIGLGDIGMPMARCVLEGGFQVSSCAHRSRQAIETLKALGLMEAANPHEVAKQSDILITMVVDEAQNDAVLRGPQGALSGLASGSLVIVMSTVSPGYCQSLAAEAEQAGIDVLDCPVSGGRPRAANGELALICGGDGATLERCRTVLETMGTIIDCGQVGMGQVAKLANQALMAGQINLVREVRSMSAAYGMELDKLMGVLSRSSGTGWVVENWEFLETNWAHFRPMVDKDVNLCLAAAKAREVAMPLVEAAGHQTDQSN